MVLMHLLADNNIRPSRSRQADGGPVREFEKTRKTLQSRNVLQFRIGSNVTVVYYNHTTV